MICKDCQYYKVKKSRGIPLTSNPYVCVKPCRTLQGTLALAEIDVSPEDECHYNREEKKCSQKK